ncbi:MAG TPA: hypothetical protein VGM44_04995 [Polyangiaceae bacterium]|jgi:hypothetical protein
MRGLALPPMLRGVSVALPAGTPLFPEECACCGNAATHRTELRRRDGASVLIGYCDDCAEHQASASARVLSACLASFLLALVLASGLPLIAPRLGSLGLSLAALFAALLPLSFLLMPRGSVEASHGARGSAVAWLPQNRLWCARERYGARLAELNASRGEPLSRRDSLGSVWLGAGPLAALVAAHFAFLAYHPELRIINLGTARIEVALDGVPVASVDATSNESPSAGALVRVPVGHHVLSASTTTDHVEVARTEVDLQSGSTHLFAPAATDTCFWLETTGYGEERLQKPSYQPLSSAEHFWVLPDGIDRWFAANPPPSDRESHSSGGLLTALRHAPCSEAPAEAQSAE